jgi:hypothetical protein
MKAVRTHDSASTGIPPRLLFDAWPAAKLNGPAQTEKDRDAFFPQLVTHHTAEARLARF